MAAMRLSTLSFLAPHFGVWGKVMRRGLAFHILSPNLCMQRGRKAVAANDIAVEMKKPNRRFMNRPIRATYRITHFAGLFSDLPKLKFVCQFLFRGILMTTPTVKPRSLPAPFDSTAVFATAGLTKWERAIFFVSSPAGFS